MKNKKEKKKVEYIEEKNRLQKAIEWLISKAVVFISVLLVILTISTILYGYTFTSSIHYLGEGFVDKDPHGYDKVNEKIQLIKTGKTDIYTKEERETILKHIYEIQEYIEQLNSIDSDCNNAYSCQLARLKEAPEKDIGPITIIRDAMLPAKAKGKEVIIDRNIMREGMRIEKNTKVGLDVLFPNYEIAVPNLVAYVLSTISLPAYNKITGINVKQYLLDYVDFVIEAGDFNE